MFLILGGEYAHLVAQSVFAPQVFIKQLGIVLDQEVGALQYALRRAVILFQFDYASNSGNRFCRFWMFAVLAPRQA